MFGGGLRGSGFTIRTNLQIFFLLIALAGLFDRPRLFHHGAQNGLFVNDVCRVCVPVMVGLAGWAGPLQDR